MIARFHTNFKNLDAKMYFLHHNHDNVVMDKTYKNKNNKYGKINKTK